MTEPGPSSVPGLSKADRYFIDAVARGDAAAWTQLVDRYQGRLVAFARQRLGSRADAEDLVQETFVGFLSALPHFRGDASLETFLFTILRRRIADFFRARPDRSAGGAPGDSGVPDPTDDRTASWYVRREETDRRRQQILAEAINDVVGAHRDALRFREVKMLELLLHVQHSNKEVAALVGATEQQVAMVKHRGLKQIARRAQRDAAALDAQGDDSAAGAGTQLLSLAWNQARPTCPKRTTIGAHLLGTLDDAWSDYVIFHLETVQCGICLANLEDLENASKSEVSRDWRHRVLQSTVGFLRRR